MSEGFAHEERPEVVLAFDRVGTRRDGSGEQAERGDERADVEGVGQAEAKARRTQRQVSKWRRVRM